MGSRLRAACAGLLLAGLAACAQPQVQHASPHATRAPELNPAQALMPDGYRLPLSINPPHGTLRAVVLALHGFNDYRNAFRAPAAFFSRHGILTVAYDQRGFGATAQRGLWAGKQRMQQDARMMTRLLCERYPGVPLYLLGESMGGAVVIELLQHPLPECVAGAILAAPAVWGWQTMPWWQTLALRVAAHVAPAARLTGEGLHIRASDNLEMLRALGRDPLVIKATRIDTIYGLTNLMDAAFRQGSHLPVPVLLLYGAHDEIIPASAMCRFRKRFFAAGRDDHSMMLYPHGYHMLLRDLDAGVVWQDIVAWIQDRHRALPSGDRVTGTSDRFRHLCHTAEKPVTSGEYGAEY
jgi:acylglycerol lipase